MSTAKTLKPVTPVKVSIKIVGTESSGFRFRNGVLKSCRLIDTIELDHDRAQRLAEFYIKLLSESQESTEPPPSLKDVANGLFVEVAPPGVP